MRPATASLAATAIVITANCVVGCRCARSDPAEGGPAAASASASAAASAVPVAIPIDAGTVLAAVNPGGKPAYTGPFGSVKGKITISGDSSPDMPNTERLVRGRCPQSAIDFHKKVFREGPGRTLADAVVAVTGYDGKYVPAQGDAVTVEIDACTFGTRAVVMTFGQRLDVANKSSQAHTPHLIGGPMKALLVALPGGSPIQLYPTRVGRYVLTDTMYPLMAADVMVLKFPTHDVTGLDGQFEIGRVPIGEVTVSALLPTTLQKVEKKVTVREHQTTEISLEFAFDAAKHAPKTPPPQPSGVPNVH